MVVTGKYLHLVGYLEGHLINFKLFGLGILVGDGLPGMQLERGLITSVQNNSGLRTIRPSVGFKKNYQLLRPD